MNLYLSGYYNPVYNTVCTLKNQKLCMTVFCNGSKHKITLIGLKNTVSHHYHPTSIEEQILSRISTASPNAEARCHHF